MTTLSPRWPKGDAGFLLAIALVCLIGIGVYFWSANEFALESAMVTQELPRTPLPAGPRHGP